MRRHPYISVSGAQGVVLSSRAYADKHMVGDGFLTLLAAGEVLAGEVERLRLELLYAGRPT